MTQTFERPLPGTTGVGRLVAAIQELSLERDLVGVVEVVRRAARALTGADGATFILRDGDRCHYVNEDAIGPLWKGGKFPLTSCISGWAMLNRQVVVIEDIYTDARIPHDLYRPTFVRSLAMVPIRASDPIGAIGNYWASHHRASEAELALLQALADSTSVALANVRLYADLERRIAEAESAVRLRDEFLATAAHELKTPVTTVLGFTQRLRRVRERGRPIGPELADSLGEIEDGAKRLSALISRLFDAALLASGRLATEVGPADLAECVADAVEAARRTHPTVTFDLHLPPAMPAVVDRPRFAQLVATVVDNAARYAGAAGPVTVTLERASMHAVLTVRDRGAGIPAEHRAATDAAALRPRGAGLGLGLTLAREIARAHGGRLEIEDAPGGGTIVRAIVLAARSDA